MCLLWLVSLPRSSYSFSPLVCLLPRCHSSHTSGQKLVFTLDGFLLLPSFHKFGANKLYKWCGCHHWQVHRCQFLQELFFTGLSCLLNLLCRRNFMKINEINVGIKSEWKRWKNNSGCVRFFFFAKCLRRLPLLHCKWSTDYSGSMRILWRNLHWDCLHSNVNW